MVKRPTTIEGTYRAVGKTPTPRREPIFNNWRYGAAFLAFIAVRLLWGLVTRPH
jgi:hypothetical protein